MTNNDFNQAAWEAFQEAAAEKYDFSTCQRENGTYYGTGGTCRQGADVPGGVPKKEKAAKSSGGGGGGVSDSQAAALSKDLTRQIGEAAKKGDKKAVDNLMQAKASVDSTIKARKASGGSGGQDGPQATSSQRQAAMKNLRREENTLKNKQAEQGGKLSKADSAKLDRIKASQREYEIQGKQRMKAQTSDKGVARKEAKASGEVADRKAAARKENEAKKEASARTDSKMSSKRAAEVKAKFDADRKRKAGGQDGPEATTKQRAAAVKNLTRQKNTLLNKQDDNGKLSKADSAKLKLIEASMESYR